jgi:hypothetical protein
MMAGRVLLPPNSIEAYTKWPTTYPLSNPTHLRHYNVLATQGSHHQQSTNGRTVGVPVVPKRKVQILSSHENHNPRKIRTKSHAWIPIKTEAEEEKRGEKNKEKRTNK